MVGTSNRKAYTATSKPKTKPERPTSVDGFTIARRASHPEFHLHPPLKAMRLLIQSEPMNKWDRRFCELAKFVSEWSKDPKAQVGAVVFSKRGGDVSIGYNGFPMGVEDSVERLHSDIKQEFIVHAEQNAIIAAGSRSEGATLYVWGKPVCARCAGSIIQAGVKRVFAICPRSGEPDSKWRETGIYAEQMFAEAGVEVYFYSVEDDGHNA